jgi:hypothetical protein
MSTITLRNLPDRNRKPVHIGDAVKTNPGIFTASGIALNTVNPDPRGEVYPYYPCPLCGEEVKEIVQCYRYGKFTMGCVTCANKKHCGHCDQYVDEIEFVSIEHGAMQMQCPDCASQFHAVAAFVDAWNADFSRLARETVEAELARAFFALQRPALPAGDVIAMPVPESTKYDWETDPDGIFVLDLSAYQRPVVKLSDIERAALRRQTVEALAGAKAA